MFVRLFVDENLDRMVPISKQPKEKIDPRFRIRSGFFFLRKQVEDETWEKTWMSGSLGSLLDPEAQPAWGSLLGVLIWGEAFWGKYKADFTQFKP